MNQFAEDVSERVKGIVEQKDFKERFDEFVEEHDLEDFSVDDMEQVVDSLEEEFIDGNETLPIERVPAPLERFVREKFRRFAYEIYKQKMKEKIGLS